MLMEHSRAKSTSLETIAHLMPLGAFLYPLSVAVHGSVQNSSFNETHGVATTLVLQKLMRPAIPR